MLYAITYMPYLFMMNSFEQISKSGKILSCIIPNIAMANGCNLLGNFEGKGMSDAVNIFQVFTCNKIFRCRFVDFSHEDLASYLRDISGENTKITPTYHNHISAQI